MPQTALVTGFPGFLASRLIPRLAATGRHVTALVEPRMFDVAVRRAPAGVKVLSGDITDPQLALSDAAYELLAATATEVFHLAAVYDLAVGAAPAERVNVQGTQHVVDFTREATRLTRHHYVSTAYVAGWRSGRILEDELAAGQTFKNHYESTKFAAEVIVRNAGVPATIYRPAIVVGDSATGQTQKFDGPYYMLRTIAASKGPLPQIGSPASPFNVVPVDFVVAAIAAAADDDAAAGRTLHLTDPDPITSAEVFALLARHYDGRRPALRVPPALLDHALRLGTVRSFYGGTPRESLQYLNHPVTFDTTNAAEILARAGLRPPRFADYVAPMVRFFKEHQADDAFRPAHERGRRAA